MFLIRKILSFLLLSLDRFFPAKPGALTVTRSPSDQKKLDEATKSLELFHFWGCPFCIKVRREMKRLGLNLTLNDAGEGRDHEGHRQQLLREGGELQVPCLKIVHPDRSVQWMYESDVIIAYLRQLVEKSSV